MPPAEPTGDGILLVDKPAGWTSHDVVARVRRLAATRKVGHAGTLDPMATGLLVVGLNRATRLLTFLVGCDKEYLATIRLGQTTSTDDADGDLLTCTDTMGMTEAALRAAVDRLTGELMQVPSAVSAIKVDGRRAYARVRDGQDPQLAPRPVRVEEFEICNIRHLAASGDGHSEVPVIDVDVRVTVSAGTYVRALARDLGADLAVGGHLQALRRTRVGGFQIDSAHTLPSLEGGLKGHDVLSVATARLPVLGLADAAGRALPVRHLDEEQVRAVGFGQRIPAEAAGRTEPVAAIAPDGRLVAVLDESGPTARLRVVFATANATSASVSG